MTANEKRLESMRANLSALERQADTILQKGDAITHDDRMRLLWLLNIAYHTTGKIEGIFSIDGCACCEFCEKMRAAAAGNPLLICGCCYAAADFWKEAAYRRHKLNMRILSAVLFERSELAAVAVPGMLCRVNEDGDITNTTHARNIIRIIQTHAATRFSLFFKNAPAVDAGLRMEGITTRAELPENARFIQSSPLIGFPARPVWFADAVFTVFPDEETTIAAVKNGAHECNGRKCRACGFFCYTMTRPETPVQIAEYLRTNKARRAEILAAYNAKKAGE